MRFRTKTDSGFSLIEVLIALLVISIGLAGIASLHILAMQSAHSSYQTTLSSVIALDLEERLWAALGDDSNDGCPNFADVLADLNAHWSRSGIPPISDGRITWPSAELATLPALSISLDGTTDPASPDTTTPWVTGTIQVQWAETRFGETTEQFAYTARVPCRVVDES